MSGPNPPDPDSPGEELGDLPSFSNESDELTQDIGPEADFPSQAYSAPESEQFVTGPYVPADPHLYDYDNYSRDDYDDAPPPRWPWVVGVVAIVAAIALVVSVSMLVTSTDSDTLATSAAPTSSSTTTTTTSTFQDEITTTTPPPEPPPPTEEPPPPTETVTVSVEPPPVVEPAPEPEPEPPAVTSEAPPPVETTPTTTAPAGPRQITYSITGTKAPGDIVNVTYIDASGRERTQRNVYIPWSLTVTPISQSEVGSVQASSLFMVSRLNCSITTSDGTVLSSNTSNAAQTSC